MKDKKSPEGDFLKWSSVGSGLLLSEFLALLGKFTG